MTSETENKLVVASADSSGGATGLQVREGAEDAPEAEVRDRRLDALRMQLDVMARARSFRVQDLLALQKGSVVETVHEHSQDVPLYSGGALLVWGEFEVIEQKLAVRVTRMA
jgi:flagellar motor switch/type III secretory pathway protein FliN